MLRLLHILWVILTLLPFLHPTSTATTHSFLLFKLGLIVFNRVFTVINSWISLLVCIIIHISLLSIVFTFIIIEIPWLMLWDWQSSTCSIVKSVYLADVIHNLYKLAGASKGVTVSLLLVLHLVVGLFLIEIVLTLLCQQSVLSLYLLLLLLLCWLYYLRLC